MRAVVASLRGPQRRLRRPEGHGRFAHLAALLAALLATFGKPVLHRPGMADLFAGDAGDHHDLLLAQLGKSLNQHRQHNRFQIRAAGEDLLAARRQLALGPHRQREQVEQGVEVGLLAKRLQADPVHLLEELSQQPNLDPLLNLLTLPVRPESELAASSQQILASRPDLDVVVFPMLIQRFPQLSEEQIMVIAGIPREEIRHTRAVQEWLAEGRQEGRRDEAAAMTLRLLNRRCGPLTAATTARIQALPLEQLEALADALLDFHGPADLASWLAANAALVSEA